MKVFGTKFIFVLAILVFMYGIDGSTSIFPAAAVSPGHCPSDEYKIEGLCYKIHQGLVSYEEAKTNCQRHGSRLAAPRSSYVLEELRNVARENLTDKAWVDQFYGTSSNGSDQNFCKAMKLDSALQEYELQVDCNEKLWHFICEKKVTQYCQEYSGMNLKVCKYLTNKSDGFEPTCKLVHHGRVEDDKDSNYSRIIYWSPDLFPDKVCSDYTDTKYNMLCPEKISYICRDEDAYAPPHYLHFDGQSIRILPDPQDYYSSYISCSMDNSVLFFDDNEGVHRILQEILIAKDIVSYWYGVPFQDRNSSWITSGRSSLRLNYNGSHSSEEGCYVYIATLEQFVYRWNKTLVSCEERHSSICSYQGIICPTNYFYIDGKCYHIAVPKVPRDSARVPCQLLGSSLANRTGSAVDNILRKLIDKHWLKNVWMAEVNLSLPSTYDFDSENGWLCGALDVSLDFSPQHCTSYFHPLCVKDEESQMICPRGHIGHAGKCFLLSEDTASFDEAFHACQSLNKSLLTIADEDQNRFFKGLLISMRLSEVWLGYRYTPYFDEWIDPMGILTTSKLVPPRSYHTRICFYILASQEFQWFSSPCDIARSAMCHLPDCQKEENCYELIEKVTYDEAVAICRRLDMQLVSIHNGGMQKSVEIFMNSIDEAWIGLTRHSDNLAEYSFEDGSKLLYGFRQQRGSLEDFPCATLSSNAVWIRRNCSAKSQYICQDSDQMATTFSEPTSSSTSTASTSTSSSTVTSTSSSTVTSTSSSTVTSTSSSTVTSTSSTTVTSTEFEESTSGKLSKSVD